MRDKDIYLHMCWNETFYCRFQTLRATGIFQRCLPLGASATCVTPKCVRKYAAQSSKVNTSVSVNDGRDRHVLCVGASVTCVKYLGKYFFLYIYTKNNTKTHIAQHKRHKANADIEERKNRKGILDEISPILHTYLQT